MIKNSFLNILRGALMLILPIVLFASAHPIQAQVNQSVFNENIELITDRDLYLTGENIWFRAYYSVNEVPTNKSLSKVLYLELFEKETVVAKKKIELTADGASGHIAIPSEVVSGNYMLRAYTNYQRNFPAEQFFTKNITVVNPFLRLPPNEVTQTPDFLANAKTVLTNFDFSIDQEIYEPRSAVKLNIPGAEQLRDLTVAVVKKGSRRFEKPFFPKGKKLQMPADTTALADIRDVSISGKIKDRKTNEFLKNARVYLSVIGDNARQIHIYSTRSGGDFVFSLNHLTEVRDVFVSVEPKNENDAQILINNDFAGKFASIEKMPLQIDSSDRTLLEKMLVNYQIERDFIEKKEDKSNLATPLPATLSRPNISIRLADFIALKNMEEVFLEIIPGTRARKKDGNWELHVFKQENASYDKNPLVLVDNLPVFNHNEVMNINPAAVEKIEVINEPYLLGERTITSAVLITTKTDNFGDIQFPPSSVFLEYLTIEPSLAFPKMDYSNPEIANNRIPDFRNTLYWNPNFVQQQTAKELTFFTSDENGTFQVIIKGFDKNGKAIFGRKSFLVNRDF